MKVGSTTQCEDPESNKALKIIKSDISEVVTERYKVSDSKGTAALSLTSFGTWLRSTPCKVQKAALHFFDSSAELLSDFESDLPLAARAFTFAEVEEDFG